MSEGASRDGAPEGAPAEGAVLAITDDSFAKAVLGCATPFVLEVSAPWCAPCRAMAPILERLAVEHAGRLGVGTLNVDANPETAMRFDVLTLPTILVFSNGDLAKTIVGHVPAPRLAHELAPWAG